METEADDYKLNSTGRQQTLHVSLINIQQIALILINKLNNQRFSSYLTLEALRNLCKVFLQIQTIQEALTLLKNTIEAGRIALTEDSNELILLNFDIALASGHYPDFDVNLTLEKDTNNDQEVLPPKFDYQGNVEAEAKYGNNVNNTTEYNKPIIKNDVKPPIVQLEYIEPILQVHYPDGTTKSTALPPRIQGPDGGKMNISEEQFKAIQEQMNKNNMTTIKKNFSPIKNNNLNNRANSVTKRNTSNYSTQTMPYSIGSNMNTKNPFNNNIVRPAMQNTSNLSNINQVRSAFEVNPNTFNYTRTQVKRTSDYSTMTMQHNRPGLFNNTNTYLYQTPTPTIANNNFNNTTNFNYSQYNTQTFNFRNNNMIEERRPRMMNNNYQKNTTRSLSTPSHDNINQFNPNRNPEIYQSNNTQINYNYQPNQLYQQNNYNKMPTDRKTAQTTISNANYSQNQLSYNQTPTPVNNIRQIKPNQNSTAMQQSQELIQLHQKRLLEVQKQLAQIQQQQQRLQEQQKQLILQQQMQRQIIQNQTLGIKPQTQIQGYGQKPPMNNQYNTQVYNNIRQVQTSMNPSLMHHPSQEIKQTKTMLSHSQNPNQSQNPPFRTQISTPMPNTTPKLTNYQTTPQTQFIQSNFYQSQNKSTNDNDEISEQQIALAQMASMQNQAHPDYKTLKAITLEEKHENNEGEQNQEQEQEQEQEQVLAEAEAETQNTPEEGQEELNIEALFMTEEGRIIFRNGLCRGIIHKYAEIDDVISKIQDILLKGVKFNLVYRAFEMGDKASTFHEKCDKLKMSLVLIETDKDIRFGGFTTKRWE